MFKYKDQLGNTIKLTERPTRIISIVPSQSELLWDLGLREELIGITKFCVHPEEMFKSVERVGGTKKLNIDKIRRLKPDLIIANKEENERSEIELLQGEFNVWISDIYDFKDAFDMMTALGGIIGKENQAKTMVAEIKSTLPKVKNIFSGERAAYFIWYQPYMLVAKNTFINYALNYVGLKNAFGNRERYPAMTDDDLIAANPDICLLSSEPFPFKAKHLKELRDKLPNAKMTIVDGEIFSWYGSRLLHFANYIEQLKLIL